MRDAAGVQITRPVNGHHVLLLDRPAADHGEGSLLAALREQGLDVVSVCNEAEAMVALAHGSVDDLLVEQPWHHPRLTELVEAVRRYHPAVACWRVDVQPDGSVNLATLAPAAAEAPKAAPGPTAPVNVDRAGTPQTHVAPASAPAISQEELAMLLGPLDE